MRVTFVQSESENLAVEYLSSILKQQGHSVSLVFDSKLFDSTVIKNSKLKSILDIKPILLDQVVDSKPDLVAFSVLTGDYLWASDMAKMIKQRMNVPIVFGGIHPTSVPDEVINNDFVDIICVGEGEAALVELVDSLKTKIDCTIKNLWFKKDGRVIKNEIRPLLADLDSLPFPDKDLFYDKVSLFKKIYTTMVSRGCPYGCTYCCNNILKKLYQGKGRYLRMRSVENVMDELNIANKKYKPKYFSFPDDTFTTNKQWLKDFVSRYKKDINKPFLCYTHVKFLTDKTAVLLKEAGCFWLNIGLQTTSQANRNKLLKRVETNEEVEKAAKSCHKAGLKFSIDHIFNIPYEGKKEYIEALKFYNKIRPSVINSFYLRYYPKTEIIGLAKEVGILDDQAEEKINQGKYSIAATMSIGNNSKEEVEEKKYNNFSFLFSALPLMSKKKIDKIINEKRYDSYSRVPMLVSVLAKFIVRIKINQWYLYTDEIKRLFYYVFQNIGIKLKAKNKSKTVPGV